MAMENLAQSSSPPESPAKMKLETVNPVFSRVETLTKLFALLLFVVAFVWHFVRFMQDGTDSCTSLFNYGRWIDSSWQPYGCMMHRYRASEIRTCLHNNPVAFIGDSKMRELFYELKSELSGSPIKEDGKKHMDLDYKEENLTVNFYWMPDVNFSMINYFYDWAKAPDSSPHLVIVGAAMWTIKANGLSSLGSYTKNMSLLASSMNKLGTIKDAIQQKIPSKKLPPFPLSPRIIWLLQDPVVESKLHPARKMLSNDKIERFNSVAESILFNSSVKVLKSTVKMAEGKPELTQDGLHYSSHVVKMQLDTILNSYCNKFMLPLDASCCVPGERITQLQYNTFAVFVTCIVLYLVMTCSKKIYPEEKEVTDEEAGITEGGTKSSLSWVYSDRMYPVMKSMAKLALIMLYFYLCDRTQIFMKEQKHYSHAVFLVVLFIFLALGAYTWTSTQQTVVLNRDQSDEWKGWMQLVILLYHYTGASKELPIYVYIRLLVASYLFMSGYGHFAFFWNKGDFSLYRFCQVMVRMNIFTVVLCLVMGRPYQFYYFVPLVSFWFVIVYSSMAVVPRVTAALVKADSRLYFWLAFKAACLFGLIYLIWGSPPLCDWIFSQWAVKELFIDENGSVREWRFRSGLDRYIVLYGMIFSFAYITAKAFKVFDDSNRKKLFAGNSSTIVMIMSVIATGAYTIQAFTCSSKVACNATHPLASSIPITAFILLRNVPGSIRTHFSTFYAWIGQFSLELFIGQYHIWLAQDTRGVLVFIPNQPFLNVIVTTFIFVCVCHEVHKVTGLLANALISKDVKIMFRRLIIFIIMLVIIWWHKTHQIRPKPS